MNNDYSHCYVSDALNLNTHAYNYIKKMTTKKEGKVKDKCSNNYLTLEIQLWESISGFNLVQGQD